MKLLGFLRSRRLAVVLLVGLTLYAWVATLVPLTSLDAQAAAEWDLENPRLAVIVNTVGLHQAYSSPLFIIVATLLTASTAACAWERTRSAVRGWRARRLVSSSEAEGLRISPSVVIQLQEGVPAETALDRAAASLHGSRMSVRREHDLLIGSSGALGLMGSPLFHWALVGLFVFAALGQLTRYEGYVNMVVGETVSDVPETYVNHLNRGPFNPSSSFTGADLTLERLDGDHVADGVGRGSAAYVRFARDGSTLREQWVFPNSPLRYDSLLIQRADGGPAMVGTVRSTGAGGGQERVVLHYNEASRSPEQFTVTDIATATTLTVEVTPVGGKRVGVVVIGESRTQTQTVGIGEVANLAEDLTLTVDDLTFYAQLQVVNDWSVPWIYTMFTLGIVGMSLTTFVPPRTVRVMAVEGMDGLRLHVSTTQRKSDPAFPRRAERIVLQGLSDYVTSDASAAQERGSSG